MYNFYMSNLEQIQHEIKVLPPEDIARLKAWFDELEADLWDAQIEKDVALGNLEHLAARAKAAHAAGLTRKL
jgi:hypothetical protein